MKLRDHRATKAKELDLTGLINIVFLILIFFIVAGTLRPFAERDIELVKTQPDTAGVQAPARVVVRQDGTLVLGGREIALDQLEELLSGATETEKAEVFVIVSDARLPAKQLLAVVRRVRAAGQLNISLLTEKEGPSE
ncbi:MAG: biopolymer transporter ExbD [Pseudomonadota bacterium]